MQMEKEVGLRNTKPAGQGKSKRSGAVKSTRSVRVEARLTPEALAIVRRAAELQGRPISDFVVTAAQEAAQKTVEEVEVIRLSREAQEQVVNLLLHPPKLAPALIRAFKWHRKYIVSE